MRPTKSEKESIATTKKQRWTDKSTTKTTMETGTSASAGTAAAAAATAAAAAAPYGETNSSDASPPKRFKTSVPRTFRALVENIRNDEGLQPHLRQTWETDPTDIEDREQHLCDMYNPYVGLEEKPVELVQKLWPSYDRGRPPLGMLNACSGSGKSALLQYCERTINNRNEWQILALAVTFNRTVADGTRLEPVEGLAMRIAERFLINRDNGDGEDPNIFDSFRSLWLEKKYNKSLDLSSVLSAIQSCLHGAKKSQKIFLFVDEPGLAGSNKRATLGAGTIPSIAKDLVNSTSAFRVRDRDVRFVLSSLKPVYEQGELKNVTKTGGPVIWIDIPPVSPTKKIRSAFNTRLTPLRKRMSSRDYDLASGLAIVMASGHWSTFESIVKNLDMSSFEETSPTNPTTEINSKWLSSVYYENARDVIVQTIDSSSRYGVLTIPKTYRILVMLAVLGQPVHPFNDRFSFDYNREEAEDLQHESIVSLNDMAYDRIVQNRIRTRDSTTSFYSQVPYISLLDIREWCLLRPEDTFHETIRDVLYSAGHDPTKEPKEQRPPAGIAFERTTVAFRHAKFLSWRELSSNEIFDVETKTTLTNFFSEYKFLLKNRHDYEMNVPNDGPRRLYLSRTQGFRSNQRKLPPNQTEGETDAKYQKRKSLWFKKALRELTFDSLGSVVDLRNGDIICPGSKNQPHSDAIYVIEWTTADGKHDAVAPGLIFDQFKYSEGNSSTSIGYDDIIKGLKNVMKERGLLYNVDTENLQFGNQISALNVKEENIVYCWSVLRKTADSLEDSVRKKAKQLGFKGSILITDNKNGPTRMFGETFKDLVLLHRSSDL